MYSLLPPVCDVITGDFQVYTEQLACTRQKQCALGNLLKRQVLLRWKLLLTVSKPKQLAPGLMTTLAVKQISPKARRKFLLSLLPVLENMLSPSAASGAAQKLRSVSELVGLTCVLCCRDALLGWSLILFSHRRHLGADLQLY